MLIAVPDDVMRQFLSASTQDLPLGVGPTGPTIELVQWDWRSEPMPDGAAGTQFLVSEYSPVPPTPALLAQLPELGVVQLPSAGFDGWLPVLSAGVVLCNGAGVHGQSTAEAALSGVLALLRRIPTSVRQQAAGEWRPVVTGQLAGRRVVIVGAGDIARRIARVLDAFGCPTTLVGSSARAGVSGPGELVGLVPDAEVLIVAVPLTASTRGLIDAALLRLLPDGAIVVNVARGPVVNTADLTTETTSGRLQAYLDVTDPEPLPAGHPWWTADNVLVTPHTGGADAGWRRHYHELVLDQVARLTVGATLRNIVSRTADVSPSP